VWQETEDLDVEPRALSEERARDFEEWVRRRLSEWSTAEIRALDRWLLAESHFEFIPAVRAALQKRCGKAEMRARQP
jgi:hypothetical protein